MYNNSLFGFVLMELKVVGYFDMNVDLSLIDFVVIVKGVGIFSVCVEYLENVEYVLCIVFEYDGLVVVDVVMLKYEFVMLLKIEFVYVKGFSLFMLCVIFSGCGDEIVELVRINLW